MAANDIPNTADAVANLAPAAPAVVLVRPQMGENIGFTARAMLNCGLGDLRIVAPRDGWPNEKAWIASSGATAILDAARVFDDVGSAVADLHRVWATTARGRDLVKPVETARQAAQQMRRAVAAEERCGWLFGPERTGLENDEVALAQTLLQVPLNPGFTSLNLGQAVLLAAYEWYQADPVTAEASGGALPTRSSRLATQEELSFLLSRLETALDEVGFLYPPELAPIMARNIQAVFRRAEMTEQEVRTFHGIVSAFENPPRERGKRKKGKV